MQILSQRSGEGQNSMERIQIFVCNTPGKQSAAIPDPLYYPVRGGAALAPSDPSQIPGDDTGDNISLKNASYCELTVQYWAWKNVDADYYGFCHYRRYFDFSQQHDKKDVWGNIRETYINDRTIQTYSLTGERPRSIIEASDIVLTDRVNVYQMTQRFADIEDNFVNGNSFLHKADLKILRSVIEDRCPEYLATFDEYFSGQSGYFCNMFIAKKALFQVYCEWLFPILAEFEQRADMSHYSAQSLRVTGHLAERLLGIFVDFQKAKNPGLKITEVPCILFQNPEAFVPLAKPRTTQPLVPVVFAANNAFVGPLAVAIKSLCDHTGQQNFYDIVVLESDISPTNKQRLADLSGKPNIQLRFLNVLSLLDGVTLIPHAHISKETFFRFLIQEAMPDYEKVLYLDCDIVVKSDVAELYNTDLEGNLLAAVHDIDFASQINGYDKKMPAYAQQVLKLKDPYGYFQAGVLLFDLAEMRKAHSLREWLTLASDDYKYSDQDVLNRYCQGRVKYIGQEWNFLFDNGFSRVRNVLCYAPKEMMDEYKRTAAAPKIIHYAGYAKPWLYLPADWGDDFWSVARTTPFYEELLFQMMHHQAKVLCNHSLSEHVQTRHAPPPTLRQRVRGKCVRCLRKIADVILPKGSRRRESVKKQVCKIRGRAYVEPDYQVR